MKMTPYNSLIQRALIIGSDGFLGRHLLKWGRDRGLSWLGFGRSEGNLTNITIADLAMKNAKDVSHIFHVVTHQRTGADQLSMQSDMLQINSRIHLNLVDSWIRLAPHAKLISMGSSCAYAESNQLLKEDAYGQGVFHPAVRGYGLAKKLLFEACMVAAQQHNLKSLHLVLATLYGEGDYSASNRSHFAGGMLNRALVAMKSKKDKFEVYGHENTTRDLLYVTDQIEAILAANVFFENEVVNCSSNSPVTLSQVSKEIMVALNWEVPVEYTDAFSSGPSFKSINSTKFLERSNWRPSVSLDIGFKKILKADFNIGE